MTFLAAELVGAPAMTDEGSFIGAVLIVRTGQPGEKFARPDFGIQPALKALHTFLAAELVGAPAMTDEAEAPRTAAGADSHACRHQPQ
jgi:hypothetical protein